MIPKKLHFVWIGDESKRPDNLINTWKEKHPGWVIKIWGNKEFNEVSWVNVKHMKDFLSKNICGAVDLMRYEILFNEGGITIDADSQCINPIDDYILDCEVFSAWENEVARPGLIANGTMGSVPKNSFIANLILSIKNVSNVANDHPWKTVGPLYLTEMYRKYSYTKMEIFPSYLFTPTHCSGINYDGNRKIYARQLWGSTKGISQNIHKLY